MKKNLLLLALPLLITHSESLGSNLPEDLAVMPKENDEKENSAQIASLSIEDANKMLLTAATHADIDSVKALLNAKANPNIASAQGHKPLNNAVRGGYTQIAELLLMAKADINAKDLNSQNPQNYLSTQPLHIAFAAPASKESTELIKLLIKYKADTQELILYCHSKEKIISENWFSSDRPEFRELSQ